MGWDGKAMPGYPVRGRSYAGSQELTLTILSVQTYIHVQRGDDGGTEESGGEVCFVAMTG